MGFIVRSHGGYCCGMTHIHNFSGKPDNVQYAVEARTTKEFNEYVKEHPEYYMSWNLSYPEQTKGDRLKQIINEVINGRSWRYYGYRTEGAYYGYNLVGDKMLAHREVLSRQHVKGGRPSGIIEIVLVDSKWEAQKTHWGEFIEGLGFKLVNEHLNSNSSNTIYVYHLNTEK